MAIKSLCAMPNCSKAVASRGWCDPHYRRWLKYGDPSAGRPVNGEGYLTGEAQLYLRDVVLAYEGDDCLIWPFRKSQFGYGLVSGSELTDVHRIVCIDANGLPPTPKHEAAHSCGNGHLACCAKRHLSWKTRRENMSDMIAHGRSCRGRKHWSVKLTEDQVVAIRALKGTGSHHAIATMFNVNESQVSRILSGRTWGWLT